MFAEGSPAAKRLKNTSVGYGHLTTYLVGVRVKIERLSWG